MNARLFLGNPSRLYWKVKYVHIKPTLDHNNQKRNIPTSTRTSHTHKIQCTLDKTFSLDLPIFTDDHHINLPRLLCYYSNDLILNICIYLGRKCIHMSGFRILPLNVWERIMCVEVEVLKICMLHGKSERLRYNIKMCVWLMEWKLGCF